MSPRDFVGEINGEFLRHINVGYQRTHSVRTQLFSFFVSELRIWSCIKIFVPAVIEPNYVLGQRYSVLLFCLKAEPPPHQNYVYVFIQYGELNDIMGKF